MNIKTPTIRSLFVGVEKRRSLERKHEVFLLYYPSMKQIINKWITEIWGKTYVFRDFDPELHYTYATV